MDRGIHTPMNLIASLVRARQLAGDEWPRSVRERAGFTLGELAATIGVDRATLFRWEQGTSRPRVDAALRWLDALDSIERALTEQPTGGPHPRAQQ